MLKQLIFYYLSELFLPALAFQIIVASTENAGNVSNVKSNFFLCKT